MRKSSKQGNRHSLMVGISVYISVLVTYYLASKNVSIYYLKFDKFSIFAAGISSALASQCNTTKSFKTGFDRIWATLLGIIIGYPFAKIIVYLYLKFPYPIIFVPIISGIGTYLIFKLGYKILGLPTPLVGTVAFLGLVIQNPINTTELYAIGRFVATLIGVLIGILVTLMFNFMKINIK